MTILLVDSDKEALDREVERLKRYQAACMVVSHSNGSDALKFAMYHVVEFVFTRETLAEMTGQELVEAVRRFRPQAECHILGKDEQIPLDLLGKAVSDPSGAEADQKVLDSRYEKEGIASEVQWIDGPLSEKEAKGGKGMTDQELHKLGRKSLLEILLEQGKELEFLKTEHERDVKFLKSEHEKELKQLQKELDEAKESLQNRDLIIDEAGSIAAAALQISGVFEAAQAASQQYVENVRRLNERQDAVCAKREAESKAEAERRLQETTEQCEAREKACREKCETQTRECQEKCETQEKECVEKCEAREKACEEKCEAREKECQERCAEMEADAKESSEKYWQEVSARLQSFYDAHQELAKLLNFSASVRSVKSGGTE